MIISFFGSKNGKVPRCALVSNLLHLHQSSCIVTSTIVAMTDPTISKVTFFDQHGYYHYSYKLQLAFNPMAQSNAGDAEKELTALNIKIGEAELERNLDFLKDVLSDDLVFRRASGKIVNKNEYLESVQNPDNTYDYLYSEDVKPIVYESAAMVLLRVRAKGKRGPEPFEGNYRNIRLFLKKEKWQCMVWFNTKVE